MQHSFRKHVEWCRNNCNGLEGCRSFAKDAEELQKDAQGCGTLVEGYERELNSCGKMQ